MMKRIEKTTPRDLFTELTEGMTARRFDRSSRRRFCFTSGLEDAIRK